MGVVRIEVLRSGLVAAVAVSLCLAFVSVASAEDRWESAIADFEALDRESPPKAGGVLFVGSSSIRRWDLERWFPGSGVTNRGFGGSQIADSIRHFDRFVVPHQPRSIFFYAGDNDISAGKSVEAVAADFASLADRVRTRLPKTRLWFIAIKPSLSRWQLWPTMKEANRRIAALCGKDPMLEFVDVVTPMLGADGKPMPELFVADGLHLTDEGYRIWAGVVGPLLKKK